jgi:hypothetical protein
MCFSGGGTPTTPSTCGPAAPCPVAGTPTAIPPTEDSIVCRGGTLVVQNHFPPGPEHDCTQVHEESHMRDWKARYGDNLCSGVPDGQLPLGGDGYAEFLRQSECKAFKLGKACRESKLATASDADKALLTAGIARDEDYMRRDRCT